MNGRRPFWQHRPRRRALVPLWVVKRRFVRGLHLLSGYHEHHSYLSVCYCGWQRRAGH